VGPGTSARGGPARRHAAKAGPDTPLYVHRNEDDANAANQSEGAGFKLADAAGVPDDLSGRQDPPPQKRELSG
jgi:hypothetical protein